VFGSDRQGMGAGRGKFRRPAEVPSRIHIFEYLPVISAAGPQAAKKTEPPAFDSF